MPAAYAPPPESAAPPPWIGNAASLLEFASRLTFSTRLPEWREAPAHEALMRLAADVALQLRMHEPLGLGLGPRALPTGAAPAIADDAGPAATQAEIAVALALALHRATAEPDAFRYG